jgi:hypothetical protein
VPHIPTILRPEDFLKNDGAAVLGMACRLDQTPHPLPIPFLELSAEALVGAAGLLEHGEQRGWFEIVNVQVRPPKPLGHGILKLF